MIAGAVVLLIIALGYSVVTDLKYRRIPNRLTFPMIAGGLLLRTVVEGQAGLGVGLIGAAVALGLMFVPFALRLLGAGDVKLGMVVGALMVPDFVFAALLFAAVVAGAIAAANIVRQRQVAITARYLVRLWHMPAPEGLALKLKLPYAPAIALGCAVALVFYQIPAIS